jgi:hypothetical protein
VLFAGSSAFADTHYVDLSSVSPTAPYTNWVTAAHTIQEAVDSAEDGDEVLVEDGLYNSGSRVAPEQVLCGNRVVIDKAVTVRSVNGAESTIIEGQGPRGDSGIRGVWMADGAVLDGFTVTNGYTIALSTAEDYGGGVFCVSSDALIANSVIVSNGAYSGGGSYYGSLTNCTLSGNSAEEYGGGSYRGTLNNCTLIGNSAYRGGGAYDGTLNNCTLFGNSANYSGGGAYDGALKNCIVYDNTNENVDSSSSLSFCCTNNPHFMDAANGNYRLAADSPCRDAGLNAFATTTTDLDGNLRIVNGTVDIGAYEYQGDDLHYITATAGEHGSVSPSGKINAPAGTNLVFVIAPEAYYQTADVRTNGVSAGAAGATDFVWQDIQSNGTLVVSFEAVLVTNNVPAWWLVQYGWTNNFDAAALADTDGDSLAAWEEYVAGTCPTDPNTDGDQFDDGVERSSGADPTVDDSVVYAAVLNNAAAYDLYSSDAVSEIGIGDLLLSAEDGSAQLNLQLQQSQDLQEWSDVGSPVEWTLPTETNVLFYRVQALP